jgi:chromatin remodeling complex protein RSC6
MSSTKTGGKAKAKKPIAKTGGKRKAAPQLMVKVSVSGPLADVIGSTPRPRGQIVKAVWDYIKKHKLQTQVGGKGGFIKPDDVNLKDVFFHLSALKKSGIEDIKKDQKVQYQLNIKDTKVFASNIKIID